MLYEEKFDGAGLSIMIPDILSFGAFSLGHYHGDVGTVVGRSIIKSARLSR